MVQVNPLVVLGLWLVAAVVFGCLAGHQITRARPELDALGEAIEDFKRELRSAFK